MFAAELGPHDEFRLFAICNAGRVRRRGRLQIPIRETGETWERALKKGNIKIELPGEWRKVAEELDSSGELGEASPRQIRLKRLATAVDGLNAIAASLPQAYGWRFIRAENFAALIRSKAEAGASVGELNRLYWRDTLATIEAYTVMSVWRMVDI